MKLSENTVQRGLLRLGRKTRFAAVQDQIADASLLAIALKMQLQYKYE
jgi:hypothetical protein